MPPGTPVVGAPGGDQPWPITAPSYILLRTAAEARSKNEQVHAFFSWAWRRGASITDDIGFRPLSTGAIERMEAQWRSRVGR